ncbi:MAG: protein BatD [Methylococcales symbiont of Iophon sp. n. MRB-2018]|nr:MAG: protein BatD [Methylococcales symbiont of Iophon sp. n. MRB-2018]KAF3979021.1 MAG: protein BatD [Methylococcales symbiont of Iophon sp. n. MRB-2018]
MIFFYPPINTLKFQSILLWFAVFLLFNQAVFAVEITATLDRNPVNINESFQLTYTATESPDDNPDFSPLKNNFEILKQGQRSSSSWINGQSTKTFQWILNVMAKQTGQLLIPAIAFGDDVSKAISIEVSNKVAAKQNNTKDLFLEVEVSPKTIYVQSQILYTLRLYRRGQIQLAQARLTDPKMVDAVIEKLTEDSTYNADVNGVAYVVIERKYAIFPQKSGVSTIEPLVLTADIVISNSRQGFNSFFNRPRTKTKRISKAITLDVLPPPDSFKTSHWIPAERVNIKEKWSGDIAKMKLGEPLTRTITLLAKATTVAQLPELQGVTLSNGLKTYPDQPILKEEKKADGIVAFREEKIAYIPSKLGSYTLPAIEVPWFNSRTQQMEIARIPETTVTTIGTIASIENVTGNTEVKTSSVIGEALDTAIKENKFWMWLSLFLSLCWLITLVFLFKKQKPQQIEKSVATKEMSLKETIKKLKQACADNDQLAAKNALLVWGKIKFNSNSLSEISSHCQARLRDEINCLNKNLYAEQATSWEGKKLFQFYNENKACERVSIKTDDALDPLYKL